MLPSDVRELIVAAEETEIYVEALRKNLDKGLEEHLGRIVAEPQGDHLLQCVVVIVVTLRPPNARNRTPNIQWPCEVVFRGKTLR